MALSLMVLFLDQKTREKLAQLPNEVQDASIMSEFLNTFVIFNILACL